VLVVDDDKAILKLVTACLSRAHYDVETASDGQEALQKVRAHPPDLVIADLVMPRMTGWDVGQALRQDQSYRKIPIIVISGVVGAEGASDENEVGDFHMAKPFRPEHLIAKVRELVGEP
jgi:CheY-like chemotaxis protein